MRQKQPLQRQATPTPRPSSQSQAPTHKSHTVRNPMSRSQNIRNEPTLRVNDTRDTVIQPRQSTSTLIYDEDESVFVDSVLHRGKKIGGENLQNQSKKYKMNHINRMQRI